MPDTTKNHDFQLFKDGESDWEHRTDFEKLDRLIPYRIDSVTVTHTGGSCTTVRIAGVTPDQTAMFDTQVAMATDPAWNGDYAYNYDVSRHWDDANGQLDVDITFNWDEDPGAGNDIDFVVSIQERDLSQ